MIAPTTTTITTVAATTTTTTAGNVDTVYVYSKHKSIPIRLFKVK